MQVAIINDYQQLARDVADWSRLPPGTTLDVHGRLTEAETAERCAEAAVIVTSREETRFDAALLARLPRLRLLVTHGMANAALDLPALAAHGVTVCGTGYGFTGATVELTWGLILALAKHIPQEDRTIRDGGWGAALGRGLTGRVLGVIGLGDLGGQVARVGRAFGMEVIAWSENLTEARAAELGARRVDKAALFREADVVSIHLRSSPRTKGLVGAAEIGAMKRDALLINTARGPIVDEAALVAALESGTIAGAGLDVFDLEPLPPDHPLRRLPNVVVTAHIGGRTRENFAARYRDALDDVLTWLDGRPLRVLAAP